MWIILRNSFLSIAKRDCHEDELLVRARRKGDIERIFPQANVKETLEYDYRYRAVLKKAAVIAAMSQCINDIDYAHFNEAIDEGDLLDAYAEVRDDLENLQVGGAFCRHMKRNQLLGGGY